MHYLNENGLEHPDLGANNTFLFGSDDPFGIKCKLGDFGAVCTHEDGVPQEYKTHAYDFYSNTHTIESILKKRREDLLANLNAKIQAKEPIVNVLKEIFGFTDDDLEHNKEGDLIFDRVPTKYYWGRLQQFNQGILPVAANYKDAVERLVEDD